MTPLRNQLRSARQAYRSARYPGDLCAELLPGRASTLGLTSPRRWLLFGGLATTAAAAAVVLSLLVSRVSDLPRPWPVDPSQRALVDWLPIAPESLPVPRFVAPTVPDRGLEAPGANTYRDLALHYPILKPALPILDLNLDLPHLPDLPARGFEWLRSVWRSAESA